MITYRMFEREIFNGDGHISHHISYLNFTSPESTINSKYYELENIVSNKIPKNIMPMRIGLSAATTKSDVNAIHFGVYPEIVKNSHIFGLPHSKHEYFNGIYCSKVIETLGKPSPYRVGYPSNYFLSNVKNINKSKSIEILSDFIHVSCSLCIFGCIYDENAKVIDDQLHMELFPCMTNIPRDRSLYATAEHRDILANTLVNKYGVSRDIINKYLSKKFVEKNPYHIKIRLDNNEITSIKWYRQYNNIH